MLSDLLVIDLSSVLAGPSVATYFSELGAQVIKIEHPEHPDVTRSWKLPKENKDSPVSAYFSSINYGKKYIQLDLTKEDDHSQFIKLIKKADILVTNFKKGDDIKLKIEDKDLLTYNPRLIHGKISGYGSESDRVAYDLILQAESGIMSMNGTPESGPVKIPIAVIDVLAAHHLKEAILLALYEREKTGQGKAINVSLYDAAVSSLVNQASNYLMVNHVPKRIGSLHPNIAPYGELFTTKDGETITFAIGSNLHFKKLCSTLQLDALIADEMYIDNQSRVINRVILAQQLQSRINKMNALELLNELQKMNVPAGKVKDLREVFSEKEAQNLVLEEVIDGVLTKRIKSVIFKGND
tara:strand:- start:11712 stop:12773 length:1062 start_codon:yes stop_codon:yes gene_type:complete